MWHRIDAKKIKGKTCLAHEHLKMPYTQLSFIIFEIRDEKQI